MVLKDAYSFTQQHSIPSRARQTKIYTYYISRRLSFIRHVLSLFKIPTNTTNLHVTDAGAGIGRVKMGDSSFPRL